MVPIPSIGLAELVILASIAGLACSVPLMAVIAVAAVVISKRKDSCPLE